MKLKGLGWLAIAVAVLLSSASPAVAQENDGSEHVYVCHWSGEYWLTATQNRYNADRAVEYGQVVYPDEFGFCPMATPWEIGMDSTPMAGYCMWYVGLGFPGQGWLLGIAPAEFVAEQMASAVEGTEVWLDWDGSCPDYPSPTWWYGAWTDEFGVVHYPE